MLMSSIVRRRDPGWVDVELGDIMMSFPYSHRFHP